MKNVIALLCTALLAGAAAAQESEQQTAEGFLASLDFRQGEIALLADVATLNVPEDFYYLSPSDAQKVLVEAWGNPPGEETLGMLFPSDVTPLDPEAWAVVFSYDADGHVSDEDAGGIDYAAMLEDMQAGAREESEARVEQGYSSIEIVGWARPPHYDASTHKLYWAKEIKFGDDPEHTLNYNLRVLGRQGVLVMNFVAGMAQLADIESKLDGVLAIAEFDQGSRYADFDPSVDKVAAYGIGALIAGKLAAKAGLFAKLGVLLLAFKKFWIIGLIGVAALFGRMLKRKKPAMG